MELSSMLAGEPFSDRPRCVDPVIAAFLRTYNDGLDDSRRQDLYLLWPWIVLFAPRRHLVPDGRLGDDAAGTLAGRLAVKLATKRRVTGGHEAALAFVHELLAVGAAPTPTPTVSDREKAAL